jgi:formamidopyrimidine-DNA glycosylase
MPELPEVETIRRGLNSLIKKRVKTIFQSNKNLRIKSTKDLSEIEKSKIIEIKRRARYLIVDFDNFYSLIIHLGMSGRLTISKEFYNLKHDHFACEFEDNSWLIFNDPRRFGFIDLIESKNIKNHKMLSKLGFEPLAEEFDFEYLKEKLSRKKMNIKTTMMDNEIVVGVGNIYINESLFSAGILPSKNANDLNDKEIKSLISAVKKTIKNAIELGGSSINDYVNSEGNLGNFQNSFKVYGRNNQNCLICNSLIMKIVQNGRSSFYCSKCQK